MYCGVVPWVRKQSFFAEMSVIFCFDSVSEVVVSVRTPFFYFVKISKAFKATRFIHRRMSENGAKECPDSKISYKQAADYWSNVDPTVDGMLGGFGKISQIDIEGSSKFLKALFKVHSVDLGSQLML
jgi:hypothetical protein